MKNLILLLTLLASPAWADTKPPTDNNLPQNGREATLCSAQTATGDCTHGGQTIVWDVRGYKTITFDSTASDATSWTCDVIANAVGHDANSGAGHDVTATSISDTADILTLEGGFRYIWVTCSALVAGGGGVTIWATAVRD